MKDADLEVAWGVLQGRNVSMELPVRVRSSDMAPGFWKPMHQWLVVDLHTWALPGTYCLVMLVSFLLGFLYQSVRYSRRKIGQNCCAGLWLWGAAASYNKRAHIINAGPPKCSRMRRLSWTFTTGLELPAWIARYWRPS